MAICPFCSPSRLLILLSLCRPSGALSPPKNLTVKFVDFRGNLRWLPGPGNPSDTNYSAMVRYLGDNNWQKQCTNTVDTACPLDIPLIIDELFKSYDVRVRAETTSQNSNWTSLAHAVQPYQTLLSPPSVQLYVENQVLHVFLTYPRPMPKGLKAFTYNVFIRTSCGKVREIPRSSSNFTFKYLLPGNFCLTASINHGIKRHMTTKKCVYLNGFNTDYRSSMGFYVGIPLLITAVFGVITATCCFLKPRDHTPTTLAVGEQSANNLLTPESVLCEPVRTQVKSSQLEKADPVYHSRPQGHAKWCSSGKVEGGDTKALLFPMLAQLASPSGYGLMSDSSGGSLSFDSNSLGEEEDADEPVPAPMQPGGDTDSESTLSREGAVDRGNESVSEMLVTEGSRGADRAVDLRRDLTPDQHEQQMAETSERSQQVCDQESVRDEGSSNSSINSFTGYEPHPDPWLAFNLALTFDS